MKKKNYYQQGYGGLGMIFAGLVIATALFFLIFPTKFPKYLSNSQEEACVLSSPSETETISVNNVTYGLIKRQAVIIRREFDVHLVKITDIPYGKDQRSLSVYAPREDLSAPGQTPIKLTAGEWADPTAVNMRFVDVTTTQPSFQEGMGIYDVYLKIGDEIPNFIKAYCQAQKKYPPILLLQDIDKNSVPPISFNSNQLINVTPGIVCNGTTWPEYVERGGCELPQNKTYYLFAYEPNLHRFQMGRSLDCFPATNCGYLLHGDLPITVDGRTVTTVRVEYFLNAANMMTLFVTDRTSPYYGYQFDYASDEYIKAIDLNTNFGPNWDNKTLQLRAFVPFTLQAWGWWTPECKPAIYLYPENDMLVNVKVNINNGFLTYTDPLYPKDAGWNILAHPNGDITYLSNNLSSSKGVVNYPTGVFPYLYYEGKIQDHAITKPSTGFVKTYNELASFFDDLLPKLGLNSKETIEFKKYWLKALPKSNYYFIGIIPQEQLDQNEPLTISPKQDTMIRVRLFFQQLDQPLTIQQPQIQTPTRNGFTVVDWGAYVKNDKSHPFTCVQ